MKKFLPILTIVGCSALFVGCDAMMNTKKTDYTENIKDFKESVNQYNQKNPENITKTVGNYNLSIVDRENDISLLEDNKILTKDIKGEDSLNQNPNTKDIKVNLNEELNDNNSLDIANPTENNEIESDEILSEENANEENNSTHDTSNLEQNINTDSQISTLYSLTSDIEESCDEFCELKTKILNAIAESEKLSEKLNNNEITLTREQRLFVNEQSNQLKNLSRQLSNATNELSFNLSDLNAIMKENNQDLDALSLKYLIVLDNLINGNEMLNNGLASLNLINNMMQLNARNLPPNNKGRILYGFQENGNPPVLKEYYLNENGDLESKDMNENKISTLEEYPDKTEDKTGNIDTYNNTKLTSNIDTYGNNRRNIDTFFNTALFDNDFMYGANNGYSGMYGNPYLFQYQGYEKQNELNNPSNGVNNNQSTQNIENNLSNPKNKKKKKFKLKSNIDTYRDDSTPDIKTKMNNFKSSINNFFNKANINPKNDIIAPIHKLEN